MLRESNYKKPFVGALLLHLTLLAFLVIKFGSTEYSQPITTPQHNIIKAVAVDGSQLYQQLNQIKAAKERVLRQRLAKIRKAREHQLAVKRHRELLLRQQKLRHQKLLKEKIAEDKKVVRQRQKTAVQKELQQEIATEAKQMAAAHTKQQASLVAKYKAMIIQAISQNWLVPPNLAAGISCQLLIAVAPGGTVLQVTIIKSSGNSVLDRSAQTAVWRTSPLPVPSASELFDNFRQLRLTVRPEQSGGLEL